MAEKGMREIKEDNYSATEILKGNKEIMLFKRHGHEVEQDVSDMIWMLFGTAVHGILEQQTELDHELKENTLSVEILDSVLHGTFDLYNEKEKSLTDYKTTSVWKVIYGDFEDWRTQLLIYAYLLRRIGFEVTSGNIVAMMKDHSPSKAKREANYPKYPVQTIEFSFIADDFEKIELMIIEKIKELQELKNVKDDDIKPCTPKERWNKGDKYAIMKKGRKSAVKLCESYEMAIEYMEEMASNVGITIEKRLGENAKCENYCSVKEFCSFYKMLKEVE